MKKGRKKAMVLSDGRLRTEKGRGGLFLCWKVQIVVLVVYKDVGLYVSLGGVYNQ
jgi:hypothetical protein